MEGFDDARYSILKLPSETAVSVYSRNGAKETKRVMVIAGFRGVSSDLVFRNVNSRVQREDLVGSISRRPCSFPSREPSCLVVWPKTQTASKLDGKDFDLPIYRLRGV
jgi:hypothetical protein